MAQVKFDENGNLVNMETGEIFGSFKNGANFNSSGAQLKSLQEMGVSLPDDLDEDEDDLEEEDLDEDESTNHNVLMNNIDVLNKKNEVNPSSFNYKKSKYHVTKDSYFIVKFGLLRQTDGRFVPIMYQATDDFPTSQKHWVKFRMWNYYEELQWKQSVMEYNAKVKLQILNQDKLNEIKIKKLILDWSFGEYDNCLKLLHCDGNLSDESYALFMGLHPSIAKTIVDLMNQVLENNQ